MAITPEKAQGRGTLSLQATSAFIGEAELADEIDSALKSTVRPHIAPAKET